VEIIPVIEKDVSKIQPLGIEPHIGLVEEEVRIVKMEI
jgi:hypothetical protein